MAGNLCKCTVGSGQGGPGWAAMQKVPLPAPPLAQSPPSSPAPHPVPPSSPTPPRLPPTHPCPPAPPPFGSMVGAMEAAHRLTCTAPQSPLCPKTAFPLIKSKTFVKISGNQITVSQKIKARLETSGMHCRQFKSIAFVLAESSRLLLTDRVLWVGERFVGS